MGPDNASMRALRSGVLSGTICLVGLLLIGASLRVSLGGAAGCVVGATIGYAIFSPWFPQRKIKADPEMEPQIREELEADLAKLDDEHKDYV